MNATRRPSTRDLSSLPAPSRLRELMRSLAMLDAIMAPEWEDRYYSFDPAWAPNEMLGSMRNGEGDWFFAWFAGNGGVAIRGFAHESAMTPFRRPGQAPWPGLYEGLPEGLSEARSLGGFPSEEVTFCVWSTGGGWTRGRVSFPADEDDPDGSARLFDLLDDDPASYVRFAEEYYEMSAPLAAVQSIYKGEPLTRSIALTINPEADMTVVADAAREIGYPMAAKKSTTKKTATNPAPEAPAAQEEVPAVQEEAPAAQESPAPAPPKAAATKGHALFTVEVRGPTVQMLVNGKPAAEYTGDGFTFYNELFDLVKTRIKQRKKES